MIRFKMLTGRFPRRVSTPSWRCLEIASLFQAECLQPVSRGLQTREGVGGTPVLFPDSVIQLRSLLFMWWWFLLSNPHFLHKSIGVLMSQLIASCLTVLALLCPPDRPTPGFSFFSLCFPAQLLGVPCHHSTRPWHRHPGPLVCWASTRFTLQWGQSSSHSILKMEADGVSILNWHAHPCSFIFTLAEHLPLVSSVLSHFCMSSIFNPYNSSYFQRRKQGPTRAEQLGQDCTIKNKNRKENFRHSLQNCCIFHARILVKTKNMGLKT